MNDVSVVLFSVILCAHNPRRPVLERVLTALRNQTLPIEQWEFLLVDNNSHPPLDDTLAITAHPAGRILREPEPGLTPARLCGFRAASAPTAVLVDDDTILDPDYLQQVLTCLDQHPQVAVGCGQRRAEFESPPHRALLPHLGILALGEFEQSWWSNYDPAPSRLPVGAGMWVRRPVWEYYAARLSHDTWRRALDRAGSSLSSCGDHDIALCAHRLGLGTGQFTGPKLTHVIPKERLKLDYLLRLRRAVSESSALLQYAHFGDIPRGDLIQRLREVVTLSRMQQIPRHFYLAHLRGQRDARKKILSGLIARIAK